MKKVKEAASGFLVGWEITVLFQNFSTKISYIGDKV